MTEFQLVDERNYTPDVCLRRYRRADGCEHWHLQAEDPVSVCLLALRTPAQDNRGAAHALEHCCLCGSLRYPVRDPFFMMLRRCLACELNAWTGADHSAFICASRIAEDCLQLSDVLLDAVFQPLLEAQAFDQEVHHRRSDGSLGGIIYQEMRGAEADRDCQVWRTAARALLGRPQRFDAGGVSSQILKLRLDDLHDYHRRCYRPGNSCLISYGSIAAQRLQALLSHYPTDTRPALTPSPPRTAAGPIRRRIRCPDGQNERSFHNFWLWPRSTTAKELATAELLDELLLGDAAAPLCRSLEDGGLVASLAGSGYGEDLGQGCFSIHARDAAETTEAQLHETLAAIRIPRQRLQSALHQCQLSSARSLADHGPCGLTLCEELAHRWSQGLDPIPLPQRAQALHSLSQQLSDPQALSALIDKRFLSNPQRLIIEASSCPAPGRGPKPDPDPAGRRLEARLHRWRQNNDRGPLPILSLTTIKPRKSPQPQHGDDGCLLRPCPSGGLIHCCCAWPLPRLSRQDWPLLPLLPLLIGHLGQGQLGHRAATRARSRQGDQFRCRLLWQESGGHLHGQFLLEAGGLHSRLQGQLALLDQLMRAPRLDEHQRLRELLREEACNLADGIALHGDHHAIALASRHLGGYAGLAYRFSSIGLLTRLRQLLKRPSNHIRQLGCELSNLIKRITSDPPSTALIGETDASTLPWHSKPIRRGSRQTAWPLRPELPVALCAPSLAGHAALAQRCTRPSPAHSAAGHLAAALLTSEHLHANVREKRGCYGAAATWHSSILSMYSYRDSNPTTSLGILKQALPWLLDQAPKGEALHELRLQALQQLEEPSQPLAQALLHHEDLLLGRSRQRQNQRQHILSLHGHELTKLWQDLFSKTIHHSACLLEPDMPMPPGYSPRRLAMGSGRLAQRSNRW